MRVRTRLTRRQAEILLLVANGNTNAEIADWLWISVQTVNSSLSAVYRALGARDRAQAVGLALRYGEFDTNDIKIPEPRNPPNVTEEPTCADTED